MKKGLSFGTAQPILSTTFGTAPAPVTVAVILPDDTTCDGCLLERRGEAETLPCKRFESGLRRFAAQPAQSLKRSVT